MRTAGTPRDNLLPRASIEFRAVVTKGSRTAGKALYSSRGLRGGRLQDRHEGAGAQQRDGALQRRMESSPEGIADLHRVTLAVRSSARREAYYTISGVGPFPRLKATHTSSLAGPSIPSTPLTLGHDTPPRLATASRRTTGLPLLGGAASAKPSPARRSHGTAANQSQPAQVTIKPGGTVTFRIAGGQTHPVGSGQAPPRDKRFNASECQPRT